MIDKLIWKIRAYFYSYSGGMGDVPDGRDYNAGIPAITKLPKKVDLYEKAKKHGFEISQQSRNSCTAYATIFCAEIMNAIEHGKKIELDEEYQWSMQEITGARRDRGDLIQNALKTFLNYPQGYPITEYRRIKEKDVKTAKKWLALGFPIMTGIHWKKPTSTEGSWSIVKRTGIWHWLYGKIVGGHAILIIGYDDERESFLAIQSLKKEIPWEYMEIPYTDAIKTMSWYILRDTIDR